MASLTAPHLRAYVRGMSDRMFSYARANPDLFKLPPITLEEPDLLFIAGKTIGNVLTRQRTLMKSKVYPAYCIFIPSINPFS